MHTLSHMNATDLSCISLFSFLYGITENEEAQTSQVGMSADER